jgi:trypsin
MSPFFKLLSIAVLAGSSHSFPHNEGRIVGGKAIELSDAPYQVALQYWDRPFCGGSIISTSFVLTAAHCTDEKSANQMSVRLGTDRLLAGGEVFQVQSISAHPRFNMNTINFDFALLKLANEIELQPRVKEIISLPPAADKIADGSKALVSGWGDTRSNSEPRSLLRGAEITIINQGICKRAYSFLKPQMVCAGRLSGGVDACQVRT